MGSSGSGKSTTLRLIAGLERPTSGTLTLAGEVINRIPARRRHVAMVFQNGALYPHLTVRGNMEFGLRLRRVPADEIARRVSEAAEALDIAPLLQRRPRELSGGEQQRVALGRAIVQQPQLYLLDEPLSSLNASLRRSLRMVIRDLYTRLGTPMIYVTHDPHEAMALGTRIAFMRFGRLQQIGTPLDLYNNPSNRFVAEGLGTPGMNFLLGRIESAAGNLAIVIGDQRCVAADRWRKALERYQGRAVVIGVRPEHVLLSQTQNDHFGFNLTMGVQAIEDFGSEKQATLVLAEQTIVARIPARESVAGKTQILAAIPDDNVYFFDAESGERLYCPA